MSFFRSKPNIAIGIDFGVGGVKLVELKQDRGRAHLSTYALMQGGWGTELTQAVAMLMGSMRGADQKRLDENQLRQIGAVLKQLVKKSRAVGKTAVASIPASAVFNAVMRMPRVPEKEFAVRAREEASKLLPLPAEEMALDFQALENGEQRKGEESRSHRVLVTATSRLLVEEYTKIFNYAGLTLSNLETESFALIRALVGRDPAPAFILDIGVVRTNLFVVSGGVPLIHRSINFGGQNFNTILKQVWGLEDAAQIEQAKRDLSTSLPGAELPERFAPVLEPVVQEIKYHLELFARDTTTSGTRPEKIILTGGSSLLIGLTRFLEQTFNITTYVADPWARIIYPQALKPALDAVGARFAVAIGLAARNM